MSPMGGFCKWMATAAVVSLMHLRVIEGSLISTLKTTLEASVLFIVWLMCHKFLTIGLFTYLVTSFSKCIGPFSFIGLAKHLVVSPIFFTSHEQEIYLWALTLRTKGTIFAYQA